MLEIKILKEFAWPRLVIQEMNSIKIISITAALHRMKNNSYKSQIHGPEEQAYNPSKPSPGQVPKVGEDNE